MLFIPDLMLQYTVLYRISLLPYFQLFLGNLFTGYQRQLPYTVAIMHSMKKQSSNSTPVPKILQKFEQQEKEMRICAQNLYSTSMHKYAYYLLRQFM